MSCHSIADWAESYLEFGLSVVPISPGLKRTPDGFGWKARQSRRMTGSEVRRSFRDGDWLGLIAGAVSGDLEVLDFDDGGTFLEWVSLLEGDGFGGLLSKLVVESSPSGGSHVYYRCDTIERNQKLARRRLGETGQVRGLIETRGEGGLIVCAPSPGYRLVQGQFGEIPRIGVKDREVLLAAARSFEEVFEDRADFQRAGRGGGEEGKPGGEFNRRASWDEVLGGLGWVRVRKLGGREYWRRPGKSEGWSATTGNGPSNLFYVFSASAHPFEPGRTYSKFAVKALSEFGGDFSACARELGRRGFGSLVSSEPVAAPVDLETALRERVFVRRRWSEIKDRGPKPMLIDGLIGVRDSAMIVGKRKGGKTFATTDLIIGAVAGLPFAKKFDVGRRLRIAYFTTEGTGSMHERIAAVQDSLMVPDEDIEENFHYFEEMPQLFDGVSRFRIEEFVRDWQEFEKDPLDLMVIDTLSKAALGAEENSNSEMSLALATLAQARASLGCASLLVHHTGKNGEMRGASSIDGDLDLQLLVHHDETTRVRRLEFGFAKDLGGFDPIPFELVPHLSAMRVHWMTQDALKGSRFQDGGTAIQSVVALMTQRSSKANWTLAQIREALPTYSRQTIHAAIGREIEKGKQSSILRREPEGSGAHTYSLRSYATCVNEA